MDKAQLREEKARLLDLLGRYQSGQATHFDEDEKGELTRDTTAERIASTNARIKEIDRKLAEDWRD